MRIVRWLVGLVVVVLQIVFPRLSYNAVTVVEQWVGLNDPIPLFMPLLVTVAYGMYCKNAILGSTVGLLSWLAFPVTLSVFYHDYPTLSSVPWLVLGALVYSLVGFASAKIGLRVFKPGE